VNIPLIQEIAEAAKKKECMNRFKGRSTLTLIQSIKTIPAAFPAAMNTCGRIAVHRSGGFVIVSNRGHQSLAIFKINHKRGSRGELKAVGYFHTRGETPRHFKFDSSGQYLIVANQDSDSIAVFKFNLSSGDLMYTGNEYHVPSPNFVCCCPIHDDIDDEYTFGEREIVNERHVNFEIPIVSEENKISGEMKSRDLEAELTSARSEISELRKMLSSFSQGD
jgi:6-phosphogluconolactonase